MSDQMTSAAETPDPKRGVKGGCGAGWGCECETCVAARAREDNVSAWPTESGWHVGADGHMHFDEPEITREHVRALRDEAGQHGDMEQVAICTAALNGDERAWTECERVISDARAQS